MTKCKICGKRMKLKAADRYEVRIRKEKLMLAMVIPPLRTEDTIAECFDCPRCGCQNLIQIREVNVVKGEQQTATKEGE